MKRALKMKLKTFFIIFKGLSLKQIKQLFLEGESPVLNKHFGKGFCLRFEWQKT